MDTNYTELLIILIVGIVIFFICRELLCWYWKINNSLKNQETIIQLLQQIVNQSKDVKEIISFNKNEFGKMIDKQICVVLIDGIEIIGIAETITPEGYLKLHTDYGDKNIKPEKIKTINIIK